MIDRRYRNGASYDAINMVVETEIYSEYTASCSTLVTIKIQKKQFA